MISTTFPHWLFEKVCVQMNFSLYTQHNARWSNAVEQIPNADVLKEVTTTDAKAAKRLVCDRIDSYLNNTVEGKAVFFFGSKRLLREYYDIYKDNEAVAAVDADMTENRKVEVFREFESSKSKTRVVMGTNLISNGLDCPAVNYVCLVKCNVNVITFLQMVGRIRTKGYVEVVHVNVTATRGRHWELVEHPDLLPIDWSRPTKETVARFYGLRYAARAGATTTNMLYNNIDESVIQLRRQIKQRASTLPAAYLNESTSERVSAPRFLKLAMRSLEDKSGIYKSELRDLLWKESVIYLLRIRDLLNGVDPNALQDLHSDALAGVCASCYMTKELNQCLTFGKCMGRIINEVCVLCLLRKKELENLSKVFIRLKREGKGFMIIGFIVNNPKLWYGHYEWVINEVATQKVEGIDSTKNDADQAIAAFENFWLFLVDQKINFLQLIFQNKAGQRIPREQDGWSQSLFHNTGVDLSVDRLQRMLFSQYNRKVLGRHVQGVWMLQP